MACFKHQFPLGLNFTTLAQKRKVHEMKIIWEDDFSVIDTGGYGEKLQVLVLPIGDEPMAF